jgi:Gram-negative bacterial TonB protein C-terminal
MRKSTGVLLLALGVLGTGAVQAHADNVANRVKKAVAKSTLNQPGTKPFHLKAVLAPSRERDNDSGRSGTVEFWWKSPTAWRREVTCPAFHQIQVVNGDQIWQKNDGDYFPEWLRETAVALVDPIPNLPEVLKEMDTGEVKDMMGSTYVQWMIPSTNGQTPSWIGATVALNDGTGLLFYDGGFGWGAEYKDYRNFHGRMVAQIVSEGSPEVTAKMQTLEDLQETPGMFDATAGGGDAHLLRTLLVTESALRQNLEPIDDVRWPAVKDGPLEGAITAEITVDREGKVREVGTVVSTNGALSDAARRQMEAMRFKPFLLNGEPVQVVSRVTLSYKTVHLV